MHDIDAVQNGESNVEMDSDTTELSEEEVVESVQLMTMRTYSQPTKQTMPQGLLYYDYDYYDLSHTTGIFPQKT